MLPAIFLNDPLPQKTAENAVRLITAKTEEPMHGLVTLDLREDKAGKPLVTEINLRHVAATTAFAQAGANMSEVQLLAALDDIGSIGECETRFHPDNLILRDIDGLPLWIADHRELEVGQCI